MPATTDRPASMPARTDRPAFYALGRGRAGDLITLLHPPYTAWHLSYFAIGAALAPHLYVGRLLWGLAAFGLAVGVAAHALDERHDRPLRTGLSDRTLSALAAVSELDEALERSRSSTVCPRALSRSTRSATARSSPPCER